MAFRPMRSNTEIMDELVEKGVEPFRASSISDAVTLFASFKTMAKGPDYYRRAELTSLLAANDPHDADVRLGDCAHSVYASPSGIMVYEPGAIKMMIEDEFRRRTPDPNARR